MKTTLTLNEKQCKMIIKGLEWYCDMLYTVSYPQYQEESDDINNIYNQIPKEYFNGLVRK